MWKRKNTLNNRERIYLSDLEKFVLLSVQDHEEEQPEEISKSDFYLALSTLRDKGLIILNTNYDEILGARLSVMGKYYLKHNPDLKNPVDWIKIFTLVTTGITAVAAILALFISCGRHL
ncbi:MAG: hypothetical protein LUC24_04595 [Bacteroidales bacterium]|nr:hypothetical protein [Bacteroidales bacterium]